MDGRMHLYGGYSEIVCIDLNMQNGERGDEPFHCQAPDCVDYIMVINATLTLCMC